MFGIDFLKTMNYIHTHILYYYAKSIKQIRKFLKPVQKTEILCFR